MRLIDADNITGAKFHGLPYTHIVPRDVKLESYMLGWNDAIDAIVEVEPTIDAVEVVRCKDCKWWGRDVTYKDGSKAIDCKKGWSGDANGYCYRAERKDGDSDDETGSD